MSFATRLLLNGWIAAVFAASLATLRGVQERFGGEGLAWGLGLFVLVALGTFTDFVV